MGNQESKENMVATDLKSFLWDVASEVDVVTVKEVNSEKRTLPDLEITVNRDFFNVERLVA